MTDPLRNGDIWCGNRPRWILRVTTDGRVYYSTMSGGGYARLRRANVPRLVSPLVGVP